ncbi:MAG: hypothetical protein H7334_06070 [Ferruginibacter sp.]|nr:hypothetical protein [Ferruginibacter sp.]
MKHLSLLIVLFTLTVYSCTKKEDIVKTFNGNLPIVSTSTPIRALVGQGIITNVRCELSSISGSVIFQGFDIKETATRQFNLTAKALYKDWNSQISMPVIWTLDTTSNINATTTGRYILNFYNSTQLVKSDTVEVN